MSRAHAFFCGGAAGLLLGASIAFLKDMQTVAAIYRMLVLSIGCAWMGFILASLNHLLERDIHDRTSGSGNL